MVSPGKTNRDREHVQKQAQYAAIDCLIEHPVAQIVMVLTLARAGYQEVEVFGTQSSIASVEFPALALRVEQLFVFESYLNLADYTPV